MQVTKKEMLREAQQLIDQGRVTSAITIYRRIVDEDPADLNAISMLGALYEKAGRSNDAVEHFLRIAEKFLKAGSAVSGAYILKKVIRIDPTNAIANMNLGELQLQENAVEAHDHFIEAAAAFWHKGNIPAAIKMNKRALEIVPDSRQAKAALSLIQREMEPPPAPEPKREIKCDLPEIIISIADGSDDVCAPMTYFDNQTHAEAVPGFGNPIAQDGAAPRNDEDGIIQQIAMAEYLVGCGQLDLAIRSLRDVLLEKPDHIQIREKLKDIYLRSEMMDRASEECVNIAAVYVARGDHSRAADYIARARLFSPSIEELSSLATAPPSSPTEVVPEASTEGQAERGLAFRVM